MPFLLGSITAMPLASVALTSLFVLPARVTYGLLVAAQAVYILMVQAIKDPLVGEYDIFQAVSGLVLALVISSSLMAYRAMESESRRAAEHLSDQDTLSDLLNKRAFFERALAVIERGDWLACTLAIIDLDDFKLVNDTFGHKAGDTALIDLGDILRSSFRLGDVIGRFGGDEFMLLLVGTWMRMRSPSVCTGYARRMHVRPRKISARRSPAASERCRPRATIWCSMSSSPERCGRGAA